MPANFQNIADYYDAMYVEPKEYEEETEKVIQLIEQYSQSDNTRILDIACGTGEQSLYLAKHYQVTGIDLSKEMLEKAREKVPAAEFLEEDMLDFKLNHRYKAAVNLYGSIGFAENLQRMENGIRCVWECLGGRRRADPDALGNKGNICRRDRCRLPGSGMACNFAGWKP